MIVKISVHLSHQCWPCCSLLKNRIHLTFALSWWNRSILIHLTWFVSIQSGKLQTTQSVYPRTTWYQLDRAGISIRKKRSIISPWFVWRCDILMIPIDVVFISLRTGTDVITQKWCKSLQNGGHTSQIMLALSDERQWNLTGKDWNEREVKSQDKNCHNLLISLKEYSEIFSSSHLNRLLS